MRKAESPCYQNSWFLPCGFMPDRTQRRTYAYALKDSDEELLAIFERRIFRIIYGPVCEEGEWRISYNRELYQLYQHPRLFEKFELDVYNGLDMWRGWKKMFPQENVSLETRTDIERREDLEPDEVTSYHVMLEQLASPTDERQQKTVKYRRLTI
uniref:Uncharacterized protein n=1 Tax=Megaselia scalaris TaxID=36166 RepID=T1GKT5_MEGSC